jgi:tetratricopeptide (TPR) repeat protein
MAENLNARNDSSVNGSGSGVKIKWYRKKSVRIMAGILAFLLVVTTIGYAALRAKANSLYNEFLASDELLREKSLENSSDIAIEDKYEYLTEYTELVNAIEKNDYKSAIDKANKLMAEEEDEEIKAGFQELLCELYYNTGQYQESVDAANKRLALPGQPEAVMYFVLGLSNIQLQNYNDAIDNLTKAKELNYEDVDSINLQLALAAYSTKDYEKAAAYAEDYLGGSAQDDANLCRYIAALSKMNLTDYEGSIKYLDEIIASEEDSELYYYRGIDNMALENYEAAVEDFKHCEEMGKKDTDVYYDLGICQISIGEVDAGVENLKLVIQKNDRQELTTAASNILTAITQGD